MVMKRTLTLCCELQWGGIVLRDWEQIGLSLGTEKKPQFKKATSI